MLMKDNFGTEFLICDKLRANAQTLSGSSPAQNKKEPLLRLFLFENSDLLWYKMHTPYDLSLKGAEYR